MDALVFGNLKKERIAINEDSLWSGYPKDNNKKDAYKYLDSAVKPVFDKDYRKAEDIINKICTVFGAMHICLLAIF